MLSLDGQRDNGREARINEECRDFGVSRKRHLAGGEVFEGYSIPCIGLELERDVFSRYNGWNSKGLLLLSNVSNDLRRRVIDMQLYSNVVVVWSP